MACHNNTQVLIHIRSSPAVRLQALHNTAHACEGLNTAAELGEPCEGVHETSDLYLPMRRLQP